MGEDPNQRATRAAGSCAPSRTRCGGWAPTGSTSTKSTAPIRARTSRRRCRRSPISCTRARSATSAHSTFPASQIVEAQWVARDRAPPAVRHRAAAVLDPRPRRRGRRPAHVPAPRHGRHVLQPADRRLAVGPLAQGHRAAVLLARQPAARALRPLPARSTSASSTPSRSSPSSPSRPGITLIQLAIAFVLNHPAITAALIGPRTMEQLESQLAAADVVLDRGRAGPHRRDRPARDDDQPRRQLLPEPRARAACTASPQLTVRQSGARAFHDQGGA